MVLISTIPLATTMLENLKRSSIHGEVFLSYQKILPSLGNPIRKSAALARAFSKANYLNAAPASAG